MKCRKARALISPWLDGEIEPSVEQALSSHLDQCARCGRRADAARAIRAQLQRVTPIEPSPDFDSRVWSRIEEKTASPLRHWLGDVIGTIAELAPRWATAVFVAAVFIASIYWASQAPARATGEPRTPYDEIQRLIESSTFTAPVALDELNDLPRPFWSRRDG